MFKGIVMFTHYECVGRGFESLKAHQNIPPREHQVRAARRDFRYQTLPVSMIRRATSMQEVLLLCRVALHAGTPAIAEQQLRQNGNGPNVKHSVGRISANYPVFIRIFLCIPRYYSMHFAKTLYRSKANR